MDTMAKINLLERRLQVLSARGKDNQGDRKRTGKNCFYPVVVSFMKKNYVPGFDTEKLERYLSANLLREDYRHWMKSE